VNSSRDGARMEPGGSDSDMPNILWATKRDRLLTREPSAFDPARIAFENQESIPLGGEVTGALQP